MSTESAPLNEPPQHDTPIAKFGGIERFVNSWGKWFWDVRTKINVINSLVVNFSNLSGTGFPALDGNQFNIRTIQPGAGIDVTDGDGVAGDPTIAHGDTSSVADYSTSFTDGVVIQNLTVDFDAFGHVVSISADDVDLDTRYQQIIAPDTGWTTITGTATKGGWGTYVAPTISNPPTQTEVQAIADSLQDVAETLKALKDALTTQGLLTT